jgi:hypothetical protein
MNTKVIPSLGGRYVASEEGRIFAIEWVMAVQGHPRQSTRVLPASEKAQQIDRRGYAYCSISINGTTKGFRVHRLIMEAFDPRPDAHLLDVNHKNGIKTDNRIENLEWVTRGENHKHRYQVLQQKHSMVGKFGSAHHRAKAVAGYDAEGNKVCEFASMMDADRAGYCAGQISSCLSGKRRTHKGLHWRAPDLSAFV